MKVSTKGRYALRMMIDLAQNSKGNYIPLKNISKRQGISLKYLEQIVTLLGKANLIKSLRGPLGGYMLSKPAEEYTIGSIIRATEGELAPVECVIDELNECSQKDQCSTVDFWSGLYDHINTYIDNITLKDLCEKQK